MAINVTQWAAGGLSLVQAAARGTGGYMAGFSHLKTTDVGEMSGMRAIAGMVTVPSPLPAINRVRNRGNNRYIATRLYQGEPQDFDLQAEAHDQELRNMLVKSTNYTLGQWDFGISGQSLPTLQDTILLLTREATSLETGATGEGYDNLIILSSKYRPVEGTWEWQGVATVTYSGTADPALIMPWGVENAGVFSVSDGVVADTWSEFPLTLFCFIGDGTTDDIPLPYNPIHADKVKLFDFAAGTPITVSSINASNDTAAVAAPPASGKIVVGIMEAMELAVAA